MVVHGILLIKQTTDDRPEVLFCGASSGVHDSGRPAEDFPAH